jgi:excinuclease ABC subunit B
LIYADSITGSIERAMSETERRRKIQLAYNEEHHITPRTIVREVKDILPTDELLDLEMKPVPRSEKALEAMLKQKEREMKAAAKELDFELAAILRDEIKVLTEQMKRKPELKKSGLNRK